jgi:hypothetical protein
MTIRISKQRWFDLGKSQAVTLSQQVRGEEYIINSINDLKENLISPRSYF